MAGEGQQFPPQKQQTQPGKEHLMEPTPRFTSSHYKPSNKLVRKVALVTGGDSGIGRAVCHCFALEGATVAFTHLKSEEKDAQETLEMLRQCRAPEAKAPMSVDAGDLGFEENCKSAVGQVAESYGRIDVLVNNIAEMHKTKSTEEIDEEKLERLFRTNVFSHFFMVKNALKHMKEGSSIINTVSVVAYSGSPPLLLEYTATKGAMLAFTRALALQLAGRGIRVNGIAPGPIWTPLIPACYDDEECASFGSKTPMKRAGQPIEVAPSYVFLACNHCSSYFTGQILHPNGGFIVNA